MPTSEDILDAAEQIHRDEGLHALSVRRVAGTVGVTPMALYKHFANKNDLLDGLVARGFSLLEEHFARAAARRTPASRVRAALKEYREFALAQPRLFELMFLVRRRDVPTAPASLTETASPAFAALATAVAECMATGEMKKGDLGETILLIWATVHGLVVLHLSGRFGGDEARFRRVFDTVSGRMLNMVRAP
jgi:AcrR family transcriptional regulator